MSCDRLSDSMSESLLRTDDYTRTAACLDRIGLHYAGVGERDVLHLLQTLDIALDHLTTGSRTGSRNGIADLDDRGDKRRHLDFVVVGADRVANLGLLLVFLGEFHTDNCVRQFGFVVGHLADVVQQTGAAGRFGVEPQARQP